MNASPEVVGRLAELIRRRNRELMTDAALKAGLGLGFSLLTFGMLFWFGWVLGFFFGRSLGLEAWQFGTMLSALFFAVAIWSAWRRVNPLEGLQRLSDTQLMLTAINQAAGGLGFFSPRHASAGFAVVLIGGPAGVIEAFGIWAHRLRADAALIEAAARLLAASEAVLPIEKIGNVPAAFLLKRLALIKVVPLGDSHGVQPTDKGSTVLGKVVKKKKRA